MKIIQFFIMMVLCMLFILTNTVEARYLSYGWSGNTVPILPYNYNNSWQTAMDRGISNWNSRNTKINFVKTSISNNAIIAASQPSNIAWFGLYQAIVVQGLRLISNRNTITVPTTFNVASINAKYYKKGE